MDKNGSIQIFGSVQFDGKGTVNDFGFVISSQISLDRSKSKVYWVRGIGDPSKFFLTVTEVLLGSYVFSSLGKNEAGYGIGPVKKIKIPEPPALVGRNSRKYMMEIFIGLATLYTMKRVGSSCTTRLVIFKKRCIQRVWFWSSNDGWLWTEENVWPYFLIK